MEKPQANTLSDLIDDDRLTPDERIFLQLRYQENLPEKEVATRMGITTDQCSTFDGALMRRLRNLGKSIH